jgi:hypothetical protein
MDDTPYDIIDQAHGMHSFAARRRFQSLGGVLHCSFVSCRRRWSDDGEGDEQRDQHALATRSHFSLDGCAEGGFSTVGFYWDES